MAESSGGGGGMGAILGMILGILVVGGLIFYFAGNWKKDTPKPKSEVPTINLVQPA